MEPRPRTTQLAHQPLTTTPLCAALGRQPRLQRQLQASAAHNPALLIWLGGLTGPGEPVHAFRVDSWMARNYPGCPFERYADDCVPRTLKEDRCRRRYRRMRCCTRDEGAGPVGLVALRGRPAGGDRKPPRGAPVKSRGAERRGKGALSARQVWITKASESEPPLKCRKRIGDIQNRGRVIAPGAAWREPADWPGGCPA